MSLLLQSLLIIASILFLIYICRLVAKGRLQIKYSLLWMALSVIILILAIFPQIIFSLSSALGFETPSNFALFVGLSFLLIVSVALSVIVSWQAAFIRSLIQDVSLLKKNLDGIANSNSPSTRDEAEK